MNKDLKEYILKNIKPLYRSFDKGHNISHYNFVTKNCINYAKKLIANGENVNLDIAYVVGAYHDSGLQFGRENHAKLSGNVVRQDLELKKFFDSETIELIAQAVEDHSAHLETSPRSIYGKIVADADRNNTKYLTFSRPIKFSLKNEPFLSKQQHIESVYNFVVKKFGRNGYVKYWLDIEDTKKSQNEIWQLLDNPEQCKIYIEGLFDEITKGKNKSKK